MLLTLTGSASWRARGRGRGFLPAGPGDKESGYRTEPAPWRFRAAPPHPPLLDRLVPAALDRPEGPLPIQLQLGYRYYAERPIGGPDWGIRFTFTFLFPK